MAEVIHTSSGVGAPTSTPTSLGMHYTDTQNNDTYLSVGTSSPADWKKLRTGDDPTPPEIPEVPEKASSEDIVAGTDDSKYITSAGLKTAGIVPAEEGGGVVRGVGEILLTADSSLDASDTYVRVNGQVLPIQDYPELADKLSDYGYLYSDLGRIWSESDELVGITAPRLVSDKDQLIVAVGQRGKVKVVRDGVLDNWQVADIAAAQYINLNAVAIGASEDYETKIIVAVGQQGKIYKSDDKGLTWTEATSPTAAGIVSIAASGPMLFITTATQVFKSEDVGETWTPITAAAIPTTGINGVSIVNGVVYIRSAGSTTIARSSDDGSTWTAQETDLSSNMYSFRNDMAGDYDRVVLIGQNSEISKSLDNGMTWQKVDFPYENETLRGIAAYLTWSDENAWIVTGTNKLYRSSDLETWEVVAEGTNIFSVAMQSQNEWVAAGSKWLYSKDGKPFNEATHFQVPNPPLDLPDLYYYIVAKPS